MRLDIKKDGDLLEREFSDLIKTRIPYYEKIWNDYIGHDGSGKMLSAISLEQSKDKKRIQVAELQYTCLESIIGLQLIICRIEEYTYNTIKDLIRQNNDIIAFHAHIGRIRDSIKRIGDRLGKLDLYSTFEEFWIQRCIVLHGKKLPYAIYDGIYLVLKDAKLIDQKIDGKDLSWNDFTSNDFAFLNDYLKESFEQIVTEVNSCLAKIYDKLKEEIGTIKLDFESIKPNHCSGLSGHGFTITVTNSANYSHNIFPGNFKL